MAKKEIWVDIPDYEGLYKISNFGNVFGIKKNKILKKNIKKGYATYALCKDGIHKTLSAHRLVLKSFIGNSDLQCNHINGIKDNNYLENLEYCTPSENTLHAIKNGLKKFSHGENHYLSKLSNFEVILIKKLNNEYNIKNKTLSILFNISESLTSGIVNNKKRCNI